jgi:hypothetical protein
MAVTIEVPRGSEGLVIGPGRHQDPADVARRLTTLGSRVFNSETEVLASLNHPHIAGIYGLSRSGSPVARSRSIMRHRPGETRR